MNAAKTRKFFKNYTAIIAFMIIFTIAVISRGRVFLNYRNILNILLNNSVIGIVALGMTMIIITGGIDLSVGSQLALTGLLGISVLNRTNSIILALLTAVGVGILMGFLSGYLVSKFKIPPFIVTLGALNIYRSLSQYIYHGGGILATGPRLNTFLAISNTRLFGIVPMPIVYWVSLTIIVGVLMAKTPLGVHIYGVGSNKEATELSGINVNKVLVTVYMLSGLLIALAAMVEASRLGSMNSASSGISYDMDAIAAVVIGGTSMSGGHGRIVGTFFGTLTLAIINNMLNLMGVNSFLVGAIKGAIIIIAVLFQKYLESKEA